MSENNETTPEKTSILTTAMLRAKNKLTLTVVPNEDANAPKKTLKPMVAYTAGVLTTAATLYALLKIAGGNTDEMDDSSEDSEDLDA